MPHACWRSVALAATLCVAAPSALRADEPSPGGHEWDYGREHGPAHWGELKQEFAACRTGHNQSPIDVRRTVKADLPPIGFDYRPTPLRIVDNGHTVMATWAPGSSIDVGGRRYELKQLHFHHPSETKVRGHGFDMEAHLVHADASGALAVVAVLLEAGRENALVRELWNDLPREKEKEAARDDVKIDAAGLLPAARGYYTYEGSLTTPPCSENVTWLVLKQPVPVSPDEIALFATLYPNDARPTQPLHGRVVHESH